MSTLVMTDHAASNGHAAAWRTSLIRAGVAFVLSRVAVLLGAGVVAAQRALEITDQGGERPTSAVGLVTEVLTSWDGRWYLEIVRGWYPRSIPPDITYEQLEARAAFFPGYPALVRLVDRILPGGDTLAAIVVVTVLGALAVFMVGVLAQEVFGPVVAGRAMVLMAVFPGAFVLSFAYSEALMLVLSALCLLLLIRERWELAGLAAALGTATRPNAVALIAACAVASFLAIRERREWRSLVAVALAPIGFVGFQLWLDIHTGERGAWFRVQREAWDEGTSFGATALSSFSDFLRSPFSSPTDLLTAASLLALGIMVWAAWRQRLPWPLVAYSVVIIGLMVLPSTVTARPRFVYTAFPLLIAVAAWLEHPGERWRRWRDDLWALAVSLCLAGLVAVTALYGFFAAIP
jgi:hypothetical protein